MIDSPVYVADPFIEAVANTVPTSLGGGSDHETTTTAGDGAIMQIRNVQLLGLRDSLDGLFADALGVPASTDANYAFDLSNGVAESVERTAQGAVLAPIGLVAVAQAMASGDSAALYTAIRQYIDAPLWAADPAIDGLATALPASLGGGTDHDPTTQAPQDGALMTFRNETLWGATHNTRVAVANVLGVDLDAQDNPSPPRRSRSSARSLPTMRRRRTPTSLTSPTSNRTSRLSTPRSSRPATGQRSGRTRSRRT